MASPESLPPGEAGDIAVHISETVYAFLEGARRAACEAEALLDDLISGVRPADCLAGAELLALLERANVLVKCSVRVRPGGAR